MKKVLFVFLLGLNVFAISETPTNQNKNSQCKHKAFYENKYEIDRLIANDTKAVKPEPASTIKR